MGYAENVTAGQSRETNKLLKELITAQAETNRLLGQLVRMAKEAPSP